jgi:DNA-directed RNA polymerase subunit RPC12/RpoP
MALRVEQECPQCGAPAALEETDHLLRCPYCNVKSFLFAPDYFRLVLPHKAPDKKIIYAPYLRFKGNVYLCQDQTIGHRVVDITHLGAPLKGLPVSLGLRPQAMKMKFVTPDMADSFLRCSLSVADILARVGKHTSSSGSGQLFHRAYIGEAVSLIYLPLFVKERTVFDAITKQPIVKLSQGQDVFGSAIENNPQWRLTFMATLCPHCGWDLDGERDSVILTCGNCSTAWEASEGRFVRVSLIVVPGRRESTMYLPFWKITAGAKGMEINSYADFIRVTKQPRVVQRHWENQNMTFWSPAFKIRPKIFLHLSSKLTISQKDFDTKEEIPKQDLYPVTMPQSEAAQSMKLTLASSAMTKRKTFPLLPRVSFTVKDSTLVYLPFTDTGHDMVQQHMRISINKKALEFGRYL